MTEKRFKVFTGNNYGVQSVDGEVFIDSIVSIGDADVLVDLLNDLTEENEQLKKENQGIQDKVIRLLDYVEVKQCVTRTEIKKWWNGDVE